MAFITFFVFVWKSLKKLKKLDLSPQNFRYDVLYPLYSGTDTTKIGHIYREWNSYKPLQYNQKMIKIKKKSERLDWVSILKNYLKIKFFAIFGHSVDNFSRRVTSLDAFFISCQSCTLVWMPNLKFKSYADSNVQQKKSSKPNKAFLFKRGFQPVVCLLLGSKVLLFCRDCISLAGWLKLRITS